MVEVKGMPECLCEFLMMVALYQYFARGKRLKQFVYVIKTALSGKKFTG
jgi:hypothetical protein